MGVAIGELFGLALQKKSSTTPRGKLAHPHLAGTFLIIQRGGQIELHRNAGAAKVDSSATVYIVADLTGMPIARITGTVGASDFSAVQEPGLSTAGKYAIDLWLDPGQGGGRAAGQQDCDRIGRFLAAVMQGRDSLTVAELVEVAHARLQPFLQAMLDAPPPQVPWVSGQPMKDDSSLLRDAIDHFQRSASQHLGLSVCVRFRPGVRAFSKHIVLSEETRRASVADQPARYEIFDDDGGWACQAPSCGERNARPDRFCGACGAARPSATAELRAGESWKLVSQDGHDLRFEVEFLSYGSEAIAEDDVVAGCIDALTSECSRWDAASIDTPAATAALERRLNERMTTGRFGLLGEFVIAYADTEEMQWKRRLRAEVREQLRQVDRDQAQFEVTEGWQAVRERQLLSARMELELSKRERVLDQQRAQDDAVQELQQRQLEAELEVQRGRIGIKQELDLRRATTEAAAAEAHFTRDVEEQVRGYAREDVVRESDERRVDEMADLSHEITKDQLANSAQRQDTLDDADVQARIERLRSGVKFDDKRQELSIDQAAKQGDFSLEAERMRLEADLKLRQLQAMADADVRQREQQSKMTAAQLLAQQASALAEKGAFDALTTLAGHDGQAAEATADAKVAKAQAELLERMMMMQAQSQQSQQDAGKDAMAQQMQLMMMAMQQQQATTQTAMQANQEAIRAAMGVHQTADAKVQDAQQRTMDAAVSWNQNSITAMANVAAQKAANPGSAPPNMPPAPRSSGTCPQCKTSVDGAKFCPECGARAS